MKFKEAFRTNVKPPSVATLHSGGHAKRTCLTVNAVTNTSLIWRRWNCFTTLLICFWKFEIGFFAFTVNVCEIGFDMSHLKLKCNSSLQHLQSDQHRAFVLDPSNYSVVDQLVVGMLPEFNPNPSQQSEEILNKYVLLITRRHFCNFPLYWSTTEFLCF